MLLLQQGIGETKLLNPEQILFPMVFRSSGVALSVSKGPAMMFDELLGELLVAFGLTHLLQDFPHDGSFLYGLSTNCESLLKKICQIFLWSPIEW
jgi:hypothetical protein